MASDIYKYIFIKDKKREDHFERLIQFAFIADDINSLNRLEYFINFYQVKANLYIIDFFPKEWNNQSDSSNRLVCKEKKQFMNFRKIIKTCFFAFHNEIIKLNKDAALVIEGSLIKDETIIEGLNISRKLKLYLNVLKPIASELDYITINVFEYNSFIFAKSKTLTNHHIKNDFLAFKDNFKHKLC